MIKYTDTIQGITASRLAGFFDGWPNPPSPEKHLELLTNSTYIMLAIDDQTDNVVGFVNAISDKTLTAYIPLLEVLPAYKGKGIGTILAGQMLDKLKDYYMVDIVCDKDLFPFYQRFEMNECGAMILRNYHNQSGR